MLLFVGLFVFATNIVAQCDCDDPGARESKRGADIVFRGTVSEFRDSPKGERLVVFLVNRVWKGPVTKTYEMLAIDTEIACFGFSPGVLLLGNDLLVFGSAFGSSKSQPYPFLSMRCSTKLFRNAKDIHQLGLGRKPNSK